jgi:hypothetical protein
MCVMRVMESCNCLYSSHLWGQRRRGSCVMDSSWFGFMASGFAVEHVWASLCCWVHGTKRVQRADARDWSDFAGPALARLGLAGASGQTGISLLFGIPGKIARVSVQTITRGGALIGAPIPREKWLSDCADRQNPLASSSGYSRPRRQGHNAPSRQPPFSSAGRECVHQGPTEYGCLVRAPVWLGPPVWLRPPRTCDGAGTARCTFRVTGACAAVGRLRCTAKIWQR